jgi:hypothetical protein
MFSADEMPPFAGRYWLVPTAPTHPFVAELARFTDSMKRFRAALRSARASRSDLPLQTFHAIGSDVETALRHLEIIFGVPEAEFYPTSEVSDRV